MIGLLSMMFMIVYVFTSLPTPWAIATFGVRKGMGFGVILMGIFGPVRGFFGHNYTIVLIATVMLSIAQPFIINAITTMSARWFPVHERATATGIAMLAQFIGIMGGMAVSRILAGSLGIKAMLIWYGVLAFAALIIFLMDYFRTESGAMTPLLLVLIALMALSFVLVALMQESRMTASN
ncbi:hypothetical protein D1BOALGB6SA_1077 [Olavius sp. associated proteobacterium Delta 1]|nr:hypothetical protein D1BOALGB6SA_1077 [Olavius sp. associated proteobacterium Delta 1]